ncbi:MAG TPA: carboxypeptidase regulatory-like domain-containing protein [Pyrinomonadaceae bacterium]|nr:carboxypeptidase regulatory-like domain-containing protein [Pyrinomonadaceae bacterium]
MRRSYLFYSIVAVAVLIFAAAIASAQTGQLRGTVKMIGADGNATPVTNAVIDVWRTDIGGDYHTKTDKKGEWIFAGLPYTGFYVVSVSAPGVAPSAKKDVRAGRDIPVDMVLTSGNGKKLTRDEAVAAAAGGGGASSSGSADSAAEKAKAAEIAKKNEEIMAANKKIENANQIIGDAFKAGNAALIAKNYDEAIKQYDAGLAADPEHPGVPSLLTNKSGALRSRAVEKYNAAIQSKDDAARTAGLEAAKADFKAAADAANQAVDMLKKQPAPTDPEEQKQQTTNKYFALSARAEAMRFFVTKVDPSKADDGITAYQEYIAVETDPAKKAKAQLDMAQMLLDSGAADKATIEFQKIVAERPDDPDANLGLGLALFSSGDKAKYQEAANYLQKFVDKAPDTHKFKNDAKAVLAELKSTENVVPEKTTTKPATRKRP